MSLKGSLKNSTQSLADLSESNEFEQIERDLEVGRVEQLAQMLAQEEDSDEFALPDTPVRSLHASTDSFAAPTTLTLPPPLDLTSLPLPALTDELPPPPPPREDDTYPLIMTPAPTATLPPPVPQRGVSLRPTTTPRPAVLPTFVPPPAPARTPRPTAAPTLPLPHDAMPPVTDAPALIPPPRLETPPMMVVTPRPITPVPARTTTPAPVDAAPERPRPAVLTPAQEAKIKLAKAQANAAKVQSQVKVVRSAKAQKKKGMRMGNQ